MAKRSPGIPFVKGHGLGNDYIVFAASDLGSPPRPSWIRAVCDRNRGIGSDGILLAVPSRRADFGVRIFNPDGSEAEKSGNGLRIFAQYVFRHVAPGRRSFRVETKGGIVRAEVTPKGRGKLGPLVDVVVDMGKAVFERAALPMKGTGTTFHVPIRVGGKTLRANCVSVGNPHCVIPVRSAATAPVRTLGPLLERHPMFPRRVNVQFAEPRPYHRARIEIWERGAGYTLASGTSACAVAATFVRDGVLKSPVTVESPGGSLVVWVSPDYDLRLRGPAEETFTGKIQISDTD